MPRLDEFALIDRWLSHFTPRERLVLGVGDDAAAVRPTPGQVLVTTVDTLQEGVHFDRARCPAEAVGHKAMTVNLSDVASMGARPRWALLALGLPKDVSPRWLDGAAEGMAAACEAAGVTLVGGNVSGAAQLGFTVTLLGEASADRLLTRGGGRPGDLLFVSGTLGDSALGLRALKARTGRPRKLSFLEARHCRPTARVALGQAVAEVRAARACIDLSDGLAADLGHVLEASGVGAEVALAALPLSEAAREAGGERPWEIAATGGEDYELLFAVPPRKRRAFLAAAEDAAVPVAEIGRLTEGRELVLRRPDGTRWRPGRAGWTHR